MNTQPNWTLKTGIGKNDFGTFPLAFRAMFNMVEKAKETGKPIQTSTISILGPVGSRGDRTTYSYLDATHLAQDQGLLTPGGTINSREFKRK
jgi:hypothetical protein